MFVSFWPLSGISDIPTRYLTGYIRRKHFPYEHSLQKSGRCWWDWYDGSLHLGPQHEHSIGIHWEHATGRLPAQRMLSYLDPQLCPFFYHPGPGGWVRWWGWGWNWDHPRIGESHILAIEVLGLRDQETTVNFEEEELLQQGPMRLAWTGRRLTSWWLSARGMERLRCPGGFDLCFGMEMELNLVHMWVELVSTRVKIRVIADIYIPYLKGSLTGGSIEYRSLMV